jgi:hypothetical protein
MVNTIFFLYPIIYHRGRYLTCLIYYYYISDRVLCQVAFSAPTFSFVGNMQINLKYFYFSRIFVLFFYYIIDYTYVTVPMLLQCVLSYVTKKKQKSTALRLSGLGPWLATVQPIRGGHMTLDREEI